MKIADLLQETRSSLLANKTRTGLTVLGIVIGIASVIVMLAIGQGAQESITSTINNLGTNVLSVQPGGGARPGQVSGDTKPLKIEDAENILKLENVKDVAPLVFTRQQIVAGDKNMNVQIFGVPSSYEVVGSIKVESGNFISMSQERNLSKVAVLGSTAKTDLFGEDDPVGKKIRIKNNSYTVIGVAQPKGGAGFTNPDQTIYVPLLTAMQYLTGSDSLNMISVSADTSETMAQLKIDIEQMLMTKRRITNPDLADFRVFSQADLLTTVSSVTTMFSLLLGSIAGISLVVGGIGIMNMMLTTVRERTREIGLRKAIGARRADIQKQFLIEAIIITVSGGIIGIIIGYLIAFGVTSTGLITASVSLFSVALSFGVSVLIGITFGYYPAKKAAALNPIDALRYE